MNLSPVCILCPEKAITTVAHIPVCMKHYTEYREEATQYLPMDKRPVYKTLIDAYEAKRETNQA